MGVERIGDHRGEFFRVLHTTARSQTAVMTIAPGADGGPPETHAADQVIYVIEGEGTITLDGDALIARPGNVVTIPAGVRHHVKSTGATPLFCLTVYAPPEY